MRRSSSRMRLRSVLVMMVAACAAPHAVHAGPYTPPETRAMDPNGVDLGRSVFFKTETFLTIGDPSGGGLSWSYSGVVNQDSFTGYLHKDLAPAQSGGEVY